MKLLTPAYKIGTLRVCQLTTVTLVVRAAIFAMCIVSLTMGVFKGGKGGQLLLAAPFVLTYCYIISVLPKDRCKTPDSPEGARLGQSLPLSPSQSSPVLQPLVNGNSSPVNNGSADSLTPPSPSSVALSVNLDTNQTYQYSNNNYTRPLIKVKRFLSTLVQFGNDIGADVGDRVRSLVLSLVVSITASVVRCEVYGKYVVLEFEFRYRRISPFSSGCYKFSAKAVCFAVSKDSSSFAAARSSSTCTGK